MAKNKVKIISRYIYKNSLTYDIYIYINIGSFVYPTLSIKKNPNGAFSIKHWFLVTFVYTIEENDKFLEKKKKNEEKDVADDKVDEREVKLLYIRLVINNFV